LSDENWTLETIDSLAHVSAQDWNRCAFDNGQLDNPFITYGFLSALEQSGSATKKTGWYPQHLILKNGAGGIEAVAPAYVKSHSQGEYVFDHSWADAFARAGGQYYPKLQLSVPFTPATGPRFLIANKKNHDIALKALSSGVKSLCTKYELSSAHATFIDEQSWQTLGELDWLRRTDTQFHWHNDSYKTFDGFLADLSSRKRKNIKKERRIVAESGVTFEHLLGGKITKEHWDVFFTFYQDTGARKWGTPYLTREFFDQVCTAMPDNILLILVKDKDRYIAGALNFIGRDTLYGRYWGAIEERPCLHFETCYYQAMEYAIDHNIEFVEAGAQGPHKLARGYVPVTTYSAHYISHPEFSHAIEKYLDHEKSLVAEDNEILSQQSPFKKGVSND